MKNSFLILIAIFVFGAIQAQEELLYQDLIESEMKAQLGKTIPPQHRLTNDYDVKYHRFNWEIDPAVRFIKGSVTTYFEPTTNGFDQIHFDLSNLLRVDSVTYRGQILNFEQISGDLLRINFPTALPQLGLDSLSIFYQGVPTSTSFGSFEQRFHGPDTIPILWTLSEPYGAKDWRPCKQDLKDKADSIDVLITTPNQYKAASNGILVSSQSQGQKITYHWKHRYPIPAYLVAFAVTNYGEYIDYIELPGGDSMPIVNYVYPENLSNAQNSTWRTIPFMELYNELLGTYPFSNEKYGHAQCGFGGGMEHSTMSFMGGFSPLLQAHELAHQWFGDKITCGSWEDIWLNEGFATYFEGITYQYGLRAGTWEVWLRNQMDQVTSEPGGSVWVNDTTNFARIFNGRLSYTKGAMVLHMIRWKMGDVDFFQAIRNYLDDPELAYGFARTDQLKRHFEMQSGQNFGDFFTKWIYLEGYPTYQIEWWKNAGGGITVKLDQTTSHPSVSFFDLPVPIQLVGQGKDSIFVADHLFSGQTFSFDPGFEVESINFDPEIWLIAKANSILVKSEAVHLLEEKLSVFPNPVGDFLNIEIPSGKNQIAALEIFDLSGKKLADFAPQDFPNLRVPVQFLKTGNYHLKIHFDHHFSITKPFIKIKYTCLNHLLFIFPWL